MSNQTAVDFIKAQEGCRLTAYQDLGGVWSIGYGATGQGIGPNVTWTQAQADTRLMNDVSRFQSAVRRYVRVPLSEAQEAALISFSFNLGEYSLRDSTLCVKLNQADVLGATKEFIRWDHDDKREVKGLLIRRLEEALLFLNGSTTT